MDIESQSSVDRGLGNKEKVEKKRFIGLCNYWILLRLSRGYKSGRQCEIDSTR
jgi:hypothetical protein